MTNTRQIASIEIIKDSKSALPEYLAREQSQALQNMQRCEEFIPYEDTSAPYDLKLGIEDHRLVIYIRNAAGQDLNTLVLALKPYRRIIQDYFLMLESYEQARQHATADKLEAIDMARRGIHNEGADLIQERLEGKIKMDHETARRFFTIICTLHKTHVKLA